MEASQMVALQGQLQMMGSSVGHEVYNNKQQDYKQIV